MEPIPAPTQEPSVRGGSGGIVAHCAEMVALAGRFGDATTETLWAAAKLTAMQFEPCLALSALLDPAGYAEFETDLLAALGWWGGLAHAAAICGGIDGELRAAAVGYEAVDRLETSARDLVLGGLLAGPAFAHGLAVLVRTHDPVEAAETIIADDPQLADDVITAIGLPTQLAVWARNVEDGSGVALATGINRTGPSGLAPRHLTDVIADLAQRSDDDRHGMIDVRILTMPDGTRRAIVDISGTKSWDPLPTPDITSLTTNGRALVGEHTAYEQGVLAAMHRAGVQRGDDVMLVGHSEGGMVAVNTARDAVQSGEFNVTHVITAAAPIGLTVSALPSSVQVLALENASDLVPHLDGRANPDKPNVTTATTRHGDGTIVGDHSIDGAYLAVAADVQASHNGSIRDFLASAAGFFRARGVETRTFQITRRY
jgi:hypothetical protein